MREIFTSGSVGGAPGNRCFYLEVDPQLVGEFPCRFKHIAVNKVNR